LQSVKPTETSSNHPFKPKAAVASSSLTFHAPKFA
jgi:hypothetical protein